MNFTVALLTFGGAGTRHNIVAAYRRSRCCGKPAPPKVVSAQEHMFSTITSPIGDAAVGSVSQ